MSEQKTVKLKFRCAAGVFGDNINSDLAGFAAQYTLDSDGEYGGPTDGILKEFGQLISGEMPDWMGGYCSYGEGAAVLITIGLKYIDPILNGAGTNKGFGMTMRNMGFTAVDTGGSFSFTPMPDLIDVDYSGGGYKLANGSYSANIPSNSFNTNNAVHYESHDGVADDSEMFVITITTDYKAQHVCKSLTKPIGKRRRSMSKYLTG
jgi:hypothetical protein